MGSAPSVYNGGEDVLKILLAEYKRIKVFKTEAVDVSVLEAFIVDEVAMYDRLMSLIDKVKEENSLEFHKCRCPAVILYKYQNLEEKEKKDYQDSLISSVVEREKKSEKKVKSSSSEDYSKSFGGTAEDTRNEKEAAELMRGTDNGNGEANDSETPILISPNIGGLYERFSLRKEGRWFKYLGKEILF